ncbi:unnamed protein product [Microthlaspi erraticum]|uniref:Protein kinase domain-containing protein n=1 Tax=Microthlaspi erraticum TaxID=1685480 RepID=A0A6D2JI17_9BRAS|nr:unnamed protein product [Microthlaspi erraticum]
MSSHHPRSSPLILSSLLFFFIFTGVSASCPSEECGGVHIPYPFGIGEGCYLNEWYKITCNTSISGKPVPFLSRVNKEVVKISIPSPLGADKVGQGSVRIKNPITTKGCSPSDEFEDESTRSLLNLTGSPFYVGLHNTLVAIGCNKMAALLTHVEPILVGCLSSCLSTNRTSSKEYLAVIDCNDNSPYSSEFCARRSGNEKSCNGTGCCQASMPDSFQQVVGVRIDDYDNATTTKAGACKYAFLTDDESHFSSNESSVSKLLRAQGFYKEGYAPVELGWFIYPTNLSFLDSLRCTNTKEYQGGSYQKTLLISCVCEYTPHLYASCRCNYGYTGNPYIPGGCKDINECLIKRKDGDPYCGRGGTCVNLRGSARCVYKNHRPLAIGLGSSFGSLIFIGGIYWLYKFIRKQRRLIQKKKFFKRNGGLLLQQQLTSTEGNVEKTRVFSSRELEKATENFSKNRILGEGGQGTVYKGMLVDGSIVAVKKSKVVDEDKLEEFINEVVILSQINHRNIVKLLGCCLETQVPVLVYEYISNGNLFEHLYDEFDDYTITTWEVRLRIAIEVAGALSYLHSAASSPIYHRDVKSTNIMLDEKYRAKVSDFGTSRTVTVDHTHLTTVVSGTVGYMDPEYFQSSQFTDKSDVYSFGVVLVELITGEKPVSFLRSQENRTLATYFTHVMKENKLFDIIDARIRDGCKLNQVTAAAKIARRCLNMKGRKRPSMREVSMELEKIRASSSVDMQPNDEYVSENEEDNEQRVMDVNIGVESWNNVAVTAPASQYNVASSSLSSSDIEPLFPLQTR